MSKNCTRIIDHSFVKVEQKNKKAIFINNERSLYEVTDIDNCLITDGQRCDYMVTKMSSVSALIELKGSDINHACRQLLVIVEHEAVKPLLADKLGFLIVCKRYPGFDTTVSRAKNTIAKRYKAGLHIACGKKQIDIEELSKINGNI
jgi:hypothetical protein